MTVGMAVSFSSVLSIRPGSLALVLSLGFVGLG